LVDTSVHWPEHDCWPPEQVHVLLAHDWPPAHRVPHVPQLVGSVLRFTQLLPHLSSPAWQVSEHRPCEHACAAGQVVPHVPQLLPSDARFTQLEPQAESDATHAQWPAEQLCEPSQVNPQAPQLLRSALKLTH
jgi:hypothetical protein